MKFTSHFKELKVLIDNQWVQFSNGEYHTEDKKVIEGLKQIKDVAYKEPKQEEVVETGAKPEQGEKKPVGVKAKKPSTK